MAEEKCKVCDHSFPLTETFCPKCGFERHVLSTPVSKEVEEYEDKRVEEYLEKWKQAQEQKREIEKCHLDLQAAKSKSVADKQELEKLRADLKDVTHQASSNAKEKERELSHLQKEYTTVKADKESAEKKLKDEQTAHDRTKQKVKELQERIENLSIVKSPVSQPLVSPKPQQPTQPSMPKTVIGKVMFTSGGRSESVELYSGLCRVTAPRWTNIDGIVFEIDGDKGVYRIRDINGRICDRYGKAVPPEGTTTRNKDVFTIGNFTMRFSLPEIDYDSLY